MGERIMKRAFAMLALALLAAGCGGSKSDSDAVAASQATGKPNADEAKECIVAYLGQCGWRDVQLVSVADCTPLPPGSNVIGEAWAYTFSANYVNVFGEKQTSENWVVVVSRTDGKANVASCFDSRRQLVGGHRGDEKAVTANLTPIAPADDLPPIVAPVIRASATDTAPAAKNEEPPPVPDIDIKLPPPPPAPKP
jgi:hypothetical protein